jgi:hypothetical protein
MPYHTGSATTGDDDTAALIVRWRAAGTPKAKPILLMGHMDVVEAKPEDWSVDPFKMIEKDHYYYGRGTTDMKDGIVAITQAMINLKKAGFQPTGDRMARSARASRVRPQRGRRRRRVQSGRLTCRVHHPDGGKDFRELHLHRAQPRRALVETAQGQCDLQPGACAR